MTLEYHNSNGSIAFSVPSDDAPSPRPLYALPTILGQPSATVLLVPESAIDGARRHTPDSWVLTTWHGEPADTDWKPLLKRHTVIWPRNDDDSIGAIAEVIDQLPQCITVTMPPRVPEYWCFDSEHGPTAEEIESALLSAERHLREPQDQATQKPGKDYQALGYVRDSGAKSYVFLGSDGGTFYASVRDINSSAYLRSIMPLAAWVQKYREHDPSFTSDHLKQSHWEALAEILMAECDRKKQLDEKRIRGRGCWLDKGRFVIHVGDKIFVDNQEIHPSKIDSKYVYPFGTAIFQDTAILNNPLTVDECRAVLTLARSLPWTHDASALLFCGWVVNALICGLLRWRPHIWITGNQGTGKSWVAKEILSPMLEDIGLYPLGVSTEAGIRAALRNDALPVAFDECEADGILGIGRMKTIIELMRISSSEGRGQIMKGSGNQNSITYTIRSMFCLLSIEVSLVKTADKSRCCVLALKSSETKTAGGRKKREQDFTMIQLRQRETIGQIPHFGPRLFARMVNHAPIHLKNIETFVTAFTDHAARRGADQLGTLLAGAWSLTSDEPITLSHAKEMIKNYKWETFLEESQDQPEELDILETIMSSVLTVDGSGKIVRRTVGELLVIVSSLKGDDYVGVESAMRVLSQNGIRYRDRFHGEYKKDGVHFSTSRQHITAMFRGQPYETGWVSILRRHPKAQRPKAPLKFANQRVATTIWLPLEECIMAGEGDDGFGEKDAAESDEIPPHEVTGEPGED